MVLFFEVSREAAHADWVLNCCMLWASLTTRWQNQPIAWRTADGTCIVLYCNEIFYMKQVSLQ